MRLSEWISICFPLLRPGCTNTSHTEDEDLEQTFCVLWLVWGVRLRRWGQQLVERLPGEDLAAGRRSHRQKGENQVVLRGLWG